MSQGPIWICRVPVVRAILRILAFPAGGREMRIRFRTAMTGVIVMWLMSVVPAIPQLRPGPVVNKPDTSVELETSQVGGRGWNLYSSVNALRCGYGQAIVGISSKRGSVLDYVQLACADISCNQNSCGWSQYNWGPSAGDATGG